MVSLTSFLSSVLYSVLLLSFWLSKTRAFSLQPRSSLHCSRPSTNNLAAQRQELTRRQALVPISAAEAQDLLATTGPPTGAQYATYWGRTPQERYGRFLESAIVSFLGVFFSYFLSFVVGGFFSTILGCLFVFWGILSPEFQAYQRNWEFLGGRPLVDADNLQGRSPDKAGLYPAIFLGRIDDVCVVESASDVEEYDLDDFDDYTMASDELEQFSGEPYLLRVRCIDQTGRELQVHTRMSEEYTGGVLLAGLPVTAILLSTQSKFTRLAALTDLYVPDVNLWIGDYPYLNRESMEDLLASDDDLWDKLQEEAVEFDDVAMNKGNDDDLNYDDAYGSDNFGEDDSYDDYNYGTKDNLVPVRRRRRR